MKINDLGINVIALYTPIPPCLMQKEHSKYEVS